MSDFALSSAFQRTTPARRRRPALGGSCSCWPSASGAASARPITRCRATSCSARSRQGRGRRGRGPARSTPTPTPAPRWPATARRRWASARASSSRPAATAPAGRCSPQCVYRVVGKAPQARYWTITAQTPNGQLIENPARRYGFTSAEIVRGAERPVRHRGGPRGAPRRVAAGDRRRPLRPRGARSTTPP